MLLFLGFNTSARYATIIISCNLSKPYSLVKTGFSKGFLLEAYYFFGNSQKVFELQCLYSQFAKIFSKVAVDFIYIRCCIIHK